MKNSYIYFSSHHRHLGSAGGYDRGHTEKDRLYCFSNQLQLTILIYMLSLIYNGNRL
jgi:hypothetical protein